MRRITVFLCIPFLLLGCGDSTPVGTEPTPQVLATFSLSGGGEAWITGPDTITTVGDHYFAVCTSGLSTTTYISDLWTSEEGQVGYGNFLGNTCRGEDVYVNRSTPDFTVWGRVFNILETYLGSTDTLSVTVDIPASTLSVSIDGPGTVPEEESDCKEWSAMVSGGVSPFTYAWSGLATGSSSSISFQPGSSGWLYLTVTDDEDETDNDSLWIEVDENSEECDGGGAP